MAVPSNRPVQHPLDLHGRPREAARFAPLPLPVRYSAGDQRDPRVVGDERPTGPLVHRGGPDHPPHLTEVDQRIAQFTAMRGELQRMINEGSLGRVCECRIVQVRPPGAQF
ncbi:MAG TPA: hypothetical protein VGC92_03765 [Phenylobacterium sp.]